jgi:hypothetical protein
MIATEANRLKYRHVRTTMTPPRRRLVQFTHYYNVLAVVFFNSLVLFVVINLLADAALHTKEYFEKRAASKGAPWAYREFNESLTTVHPGLTRDQISKLISETRHLAQEYEVYTQFKEIPCEGKYVNVDSRGFRPIVGQKPWPPRKGDYVVFVFGGSTTFGYGVEDNLTIASHIQKLLNTNYGISASVYNFGRGSYFSAQERVLFEKLLFEGFVPHMAIFIDGLNDLTYFDGLPAHTRDLKKLMDEGDVPLTQRVIRELPVTRALKALLSRGGNQIDQSKAFEKAPPDQQAKLVHSVLDRYKVNKRMIEAMCKEFDVIPVFVWQPVPVYKYDAKYNIFGGYNYEIPLPALQPGYNLMAKTAESQVLGRNFIWAADVQENLQKPLYVDAVHYSGEMSEILAKYILNAITERRLDARLTPTTPSEQQSLISKDTN